MYYKSSHLISTIVVVFNGAKTLQQCIDSIVQQTYPSKELIIIDGGSKDGTVDLLKANCEQISYWISEPDRGIYNAFNKGLAQAKGEWICFLGADDYFWDSNVLERMSEHLERLPSSIRVAYGQVMIVNPEGEKICLLGEPWKKKGDRFMQIILFMPHQGVMHRRSLFEQHGQFDESFQITGDNELLLRELKTADPFFIPGIIITAMQQGGISSEPASSLLVMRETMYAATMHNQRLPRWYWLMAMAKAYIKLLLRGVVGDRLVMKLLNIYSRVKRIRPFGKRT
jgi:glycosyltransferase involved in cell wall biosynthesis